MPSKKTPPTSPPWQVILEEIRSQNRSTIEAVEASRTALEQRIDRLEHESGSRDAVLEMAIRELRLAVQQNGADIHQVQGDVKVLQGDVREVQGDVKILQGDVRGLAAKIEALAHIEERVSALEKRFP